MTQRDLFDSKFDEQRFRDFAVKLLPDFEKERRPIVTNGILKSVKMLGSSEACKLAVIVVRVDETQNKKRIMITQEAFRILKQHRIRNALVAFYIDSENQ